MRNEIKSEIVKNKIEIIYKKLKSTMDIHFINSESTEKETTLKFIFLIKTKL